MASQQSELQFALASGGRYQVGSHAATWQRRPDDEKIVDLSFRGKTFEVTREGSGPNGRPRMFINGIRTLDGRLFQGRSLRELIRKLDCHFDDFIEIPARLQRIERKLDALITGRRVPKTKLCLVMVTSSWPQERYIPRAAIGGFARVPIPTIAASQNMAAGEYRILQAVLFCAQGTGLLTAGKNRLAKLANVPEGDVKHYLRSLCNRQILRPTGRILKYGIREHELLTHPWLGDNDASGGEKNTDGGGISAERGRTVLPLKTNKTTTDKTINKKAVNRPQAARIEEEELLRRLQEICGAKEMELNGGGWRNDARECPRALRIAIDDYMVRRDNYHLGKVVNPAAYIKKQYRLYRAKISQSDKAIAGRSQDKSLSELVRESIQQARTSKPKAERKFRDGKALWM